MIDKSPSIKKDSSPYQQEKSLNNISPNLTIVKPENLNETQAQNNLINNSESYTNKNNQNFTFKIIKRRAPWNKKEDDAIIELVNKYGTSNWTIIANEMANMYKSKHRNGKQCRERWHNHLDPVVNKENWTEEEENILFSKHLEYGNKWSDISKFLPGRTDNSIKNHFYSKLRKFIRKILKQINKENLLKNNGIDYYKYNSDKVYKLLKKYKITYKNVTKDTILDLIISTEKNQKGKIFNLSENKSITNDTSNNIFPSTELNLEKKLSLEENKINNSNKSKSSSGKKYKIKSKIKTNDENNGNELLLKKEKKLFKSKLVTKFKSTKDDNKENITKNKLNLINQNNNDNTQNKNIIKKNKKNKNINIINEINQYNNNESGKKKLTINTDYVNETYKNKSKSKQKIKIKEKSKNNTLDSKKLLGKKRHRKKKRKISISLSTPENKKTKIDRIMPKRKYIFGLGQKFPISNQRHSKRNKNKIEINPEDFDPLINNVEIVRDGLEIHSKTIILINKNLLTEKLFPERNYVFHPNLNISIPLSPKNQQFPGSTIIRTIPSGEENYISKFHDRNITIGPPTPMNGYFEPQISPIALNNIMMYPPPSTKNIFNVDLGYENNFLRKNFQHPYTPSAFINPSILSPTTPTREINLHNKIIVQNNSNVINSDNNIKKPTPLNMDYIENDNNDNINTNPFFVGNENINLNSTTNKMNTPANIFNLSPTSPFIPRNFGENHI